MQTPNSDGPEVPLFDVVIRMPPDVKLETIQKLAEFEAGLSPDRVKRLIRVLSTTPNAKVGAAITLQRAEEEKVRFTKAGLDVEIVPLEPRNLLHGRDSAHAKLISLKDFNESMNPIEKISDTHAADLTGEIGDTTFGQAQSVGNRNIFGGKSGLLIGATLVVVAGLFYASGKGINLNSIALPWSKKDPAVNVTGNPSPLQTQLATAAAVFDQASDPYADDPLVLTAGGKRPSARGSTIEEAITEATGSAGGAEAITKQTKQLLTAEFAVLLAELGQDTRARVVLKALPNDANSVADQRLASRLTMAQMELQAWATLRMDSTQSKQAIQELKTKTQAIANAQDRALLQGQIADILSRSSQLSLAAPRAFLSLAAESLKSVSGPQSITAQNNLMVTTAKVFLRETTDRAKLGAWSKAKAGSVQVESLIKQAPDGWTQARLYAIDFQGKQQTGQNDKAAKSLESALELAGKAVNLVDRANKLRSIAQLSDAGTYEQFETAANALQNQVSVKTGLEKAQVFTELSLLYIEASLPGKAAALRGQAQAITGLSAPDIASINVDLIARGDMATAKMLHGLGRYAEAEAMLQRVGGYLF